MKASGGESVYWSKRFDVMKASGAPSGNKLVHGSILFGVAGWGE